MSLQLVCAGHTDHDMVWGSLQLTYYTCQSARLQVSVAGGRGGCTGRLHALIIKAPRRKSTDSKFQDSTLDLGKHHGGPWPYQDTYSFKFVPTAAGPGGPGWDSPCTVSHYVYSYLTNKWAEHRVWDTNGARNSRFDGRLQQCRQYLQLADRQSGWDQVSQKVKLSLLTDHSGTVFLEQTHHPDNKKHTEDLLSTVPLYTLYIRLMSFQHAL